MEELFFPTMSHFEHGNGWCAGCGVMRYRLTVTTEEKDEGGTVTKPREMVISVWYGPFCREYAEETDRAVFPLSEEGRQAAFDWVTARAEEMNRAPQRTRADTMAYYRRKRREERDAG